MSGQRLLGIVGFLLQLVPLGLLAVWLLLITSPNATTIGWWYGQPLFIALAIFAVLATFSRIAAACAAVLTLGVLAYGLRLWLPGVGVIAGQGFAVLATLSLVGWVLRMLAWRTRSKAQLPQHPST